MHDSLSCKVSILGLLLSYVPQLEGLLESMSLPQRCEEIQLSRCYIVPACIDKMLSYRRQTALQSELVLAKSIKTGIRRQFYGHYIGLSSTTVT